MARRVCTALIGALALMSGPSLAKQTEPAPAPAAKASPTVSGVTVTAPEKPNPLVDPTLQDLKARMPESAWSEQLARFRDDICVKVQGLPAGFDGFIAKRIAAMASEVGAPFDKRAHCRPNVNVIFSTKPQAQISDIARRKETLLGFYYQAQFRTLTTFDRPIQAWYATKVIDTFGNPWIEVHQTCKYDPRAGCDRPHGRAGSRLGADMSAEIAHTLIIADANKVAGEKIDAVADYVAVLALARWTGLDRCAHIPSVLNLMADNCAGAPEAATPQDLALLKALYAVDPREFGFQQRATIASAVRKAAAGDQEVAR